MEQGNELEVRSIISTINIKDSPDELMLLLMPHLSALIDAAENRKIPDNLTKHIARNAKTVDESVSVISLSQSDTNKKDKFRSVTIKDTPLEIVIEEPLDEETLTGLMRLVGDYPSQEMSKDAEKSLVNLLQSYKLIERLKYHRTGLRIRVKISAKTFSALYGLPQIFNLFTGRDQEIAQLKRIHGTLVVTDAEEGGVEVDHLQKKFSQVSGTGGIGKSQLINHFARLQFRDKIYNWVVWLYGGDEIAEIRVNLDTQLTQLAVTLGININQMKGKVLYNEIYSRLRNRGPGLLVIDDAPNYDSVLPFLPRNDLQNISVIITTRNGINFGNTIAKMVLDVLTLEDAVAYIKKVPTFSVSTSEAELLATTLGRYPLAITQALSYIIANDCTILEFCQRYESLQRARDTYVKTPVSGDDPYFSEHVERTRKYEATIYSIVRLSLELIRSRSETQDEFDRTKLVLDCASFLSPEVAIPKKLLGTLIPNDEGEVIIEKILSALRRFSLIEDSNERAAYRMHKVVQDVLKIAMSADNFLAHLLKWSAHIKKYVESFVSQDHEYNEIVIIKLRPHYITLLTKTVEFTEDSNQLVARGVFNNAIGMSFMLQGNEAEAVSYFKEGEICYAKLLAPGYDRNITVNDYYKANCQMNYGVCLLSLGDPKKGLSLLLEACAMMVAIYPEGNKDVCGALLNLGIGFIINQKIDDAERTLNKALNLGNRFFSPTHIFIGKCKANLAMVFSRRHGLEIASGRLTLEAVCKHRYLEMAIRYATEALDIFKSSQSQSNPDSARVLMHLSTLMFMRNPIMVKKYAEEGLKVSQVVFDEKHGVVGCCLLNIGRASFESGYIKKAKRYLERALPILQQAGGIYDTERWICQDILRKILTEPVARQPYHTSIQFFDGTIVRKSELDEIFSKSPEPVRLDGPK